MFLSVCSDHCKWGGDLSSDFLNFIPTIENEEEICIADLFFFGLHAKAGLTNNHRNGSSDISR